MNKRNIVIVGILVGALAVGGIFATAFANTGVRKGPSNSWGYALQSKGQFDGAVKQWFGMRGDGRCPGEGVAERRVGEMAEELSKFLGISEDTLRSEIKNGKTLAEIAKEHGKNTNDLVNFFVSEAKEHLQEALKAGRITKEQYENALKNMKQRIEQRINEKMPFGRFGMGMYGKDEMTGHSGMPFSGKSGRAGHRGMPHRGMGHMGNSESPNMP